MRVSLYLLVAVAAAFIGLSNVVSATTDSTKTLDVEASSVQTKRLLRTAADSDDIEREERSVLQMKWLLGGGPTEKLKTASVNGAKQALAKAKMERAYAKQRSGYVNLLNKMEGNQDAEKRITALWKAQKIESPKIFGPFKKNPPANTVFEGLERRYAKFKPKTEAS